MFNTDQISDCWNGNFKNEKVIPGVYVYVLDIGITQCDNVELKRIVGDVTVLW